MRAHVGDNRRIAVDKIMLHGAHALKDAGLEIFDGEEIMEKTRSIKGPDEVLALRCAQVACENALAEMRRLLTISRVYALMTEGDDAMAEGDMDHAGRAYARAGELAPDNHEVTFWHAFGLATAGDAEAAGEVGGLASERALGGLPLAAAVGTGGSEEGELLALVTAAAVGGVAGCEAADGEGEPVARDAGAAAAGAGS